MFRVSNPFSISKAILALSIVSLVVMMGSSMATPSLALYAGNYPGANEFVVGALIAGFAVGRLLFDIPGGFLADRAGISRTMLLGLAVLVGSSLLAGVAPSSWILLSARILEGIGSAIYVSAAIAFVLFASDPMKRGNTIGTYQSILMTGPIVGPVAGAPVAAYFGLNAPYFAFAAMMAGALALVAYLGYRGTFVIGSCSLDRDTDEESRKAGMSLYVNTAGVATFGFAFLRSGIYSTGMPLFAYGSLELSLFDVGVILTAASLANLVTSYFSGRITMKYGMRNTLFAAIIFSAALVCTIPLSTSALHLLVLMILMGVCSGFFGQTIAWAAEQIENRVRNTDSKASNNARTIRSHVTRGIGLNRMIGDGGLILGPLFVGYVVSLFVADPIVWFVSFGLTGVVLCIISMLVLRSGRMPVMLRTDATRL